MDNTSTAPYPSCNILGVRIDILRWIEMIDIVDFHIRQQKQITLSYANAHTLNSAVESMETQHQLNNSDIIYCDGNGVRWAAKYNGIEIPERHTGADWIWKLAFEAQQRSWSIYWLGNPPGITERAAQRLKQHYPNLVIHHDHGFHKKTGPDNEAVLARIKTARPDILLVGMGTPAQEKWMHQNKVNLPNVPVFWALGAAAEFVAQPETRPGPRWMLTHLEWMSRLLADPRRMWHRYLVGNPKFAWRILKEK